MADVRTPELVINKLSKQQYENIQNPSDTEIYLVPEDEEHKPICYPTTASDVKTTSMLVKSSVSDNGKILTENGFVYNTSGNPTVSDTKVICDLGVGFMEKKLENLTRDTEYHIKSYGQNASGLVYGSELVQRTWNTPIPPEYQLVEYLESTGAQYINLAFYNSGGYKYHSKFIITNKNARTWSSIFGARTTSQASNAYVVGWGSGQTTFFFNIGGSSLNYGTVINNVEYDIITTESVITINNVQYSINRPTVANNLDLLLFAFNNNGTPDLTQSSNMQLKLFEISDIYNNFIKQLYPVYRIADSKPGMYDIVNHVFYTNQGTGEFAVGPDKEFDE